MNRVDHGKTTLTAAITAVLASAPGAVNKPVADQIDNARREATWYYYRSSRKEYESNRHYAHVDMPELADYVRHDHQLPLRLTVRYWLSLQLTAQCLQTREHVLLTKAGWCAKDRCLLEQDGHGWRRNGWSWSKKKFANFLKKNNFDKNAQSSRVLLLGSWRWREIRRRYYYGIGWRNEDSYIQSQHVTWTSHSLCQLRMSSQLGSWYGNGRIEQGVVKLNDEIEIVFRSQLRSQLQLVLKPSRKSLDQDPEAGDSRCLATWYWAQRR